MWREKLEIYDTPPIHEYRKLFLMETPMSNEQSGQVHEPSTTPVETQNPIINPDSELKKAFQIKYAGPGTYHMLKSEGFGLANIQIYITLEEMVVLRHALNKWFNEQIPFNSGDSYDK